MYGITIYNGKLFEFKATDDFIISNKHKAKFIIPDMELDSNPKTYSINRNFFERVKACISKHNQIPIYFLGDILNDPNGKAKDGKDICGEFLNWFSTLNNTHVIRGNGEMDLIDDGILDASPTKIDIENYKLTFGHGKYTHVIYLKKLQNETEEEMRLRIQNTLEKIYRESIVYEYLTDEKIILSHAPLLDYEDYYFDVVGNKIIKRDRGDFKTHFTSIKNREKDYNDLRNLFYRNDEIKNRIAGHIRFYADWNIIKKENKFCILTNDEPYYEKLKGKIYYAKPGRTFNGTRKMFVLFNGVPPPTIKISVDDTHRYLNGIFQQEKFSGGYSSKIMLYEYHEDTFAKLLFYLFFMLVIILIVSLITSNIYYKNNTSIKQT